MNVKAVPFRLDLLIIYVLVQFYNNFIIKAALGTKGISRDRPIWVLPIYRYRPKRTILSASIGVGRTLLYSSLNQTTCARKHNEASQDSILQQR